MNNTKKFIIISFFCVLGIISGFVIGHFSNDQYNESINESTSDISNFSSQIAINSNNSTEGETTSEEQNEYPFELYHSFLTNSSEEIIESLNNNPIDEEYCKKYINSKSPSEEQEILSSWNSAYEDEFKNAKAVLENSINEKATDKDTYNNEILKIIEEYSICCSSYTETTAQLAYGFEEFNLGQGTNHTYDLLLNSLEMNRINTLHLIECIYMLDGSYTWIE